ncbi:hypothetical protein [Thermoflexus sp.]|uniref:hypothetical protein n=1 Tax=Thermoflexus sp. TaxID=1969742 RepID=UPI002ADE3FF0|nr:hypothetical protein [Thermoflexus sp.]
MIQSEWVVIVSVAMAFLMLGWLGFIVVIWGVSVIGLIREGIRFFLRSSEQPAAWWELSETDAPPSDQGSGGPSKAA